MPFNAIASIIQQAGESGRNYENMAFTRYRDSYLHDYAVEDAKQQFRNELQLMKKQNDYAQSNRQENQVNDKLREVIGLKRAGLNPATLDGGTFQAAAVPSLGHSEKANTPSPPVANFNASSGVMQGALIASEIENMNAQTDKVKAETANIEGESEQWNTQLKSWLKDVSESDEYDGVVRVFATELSKNLDNVKLNTGSAKAINDFITLLQNDRHSVLDQVQTEKNIMEVVHEIEYNVPEIRAKMSTNELSRQVADLQKVIIDTLYVSGLSMKTPSEIEKLQSEVKKNLADAAATYHGDIPSMVENKDWQALLTKAATNVLDKGLDLLSVAGKAKLVGRAVGKMSETAEKALKSLPSVGKSTPKGMPQSLQKFLKNQQIENQGFHKLKQKFGADKANTIINRWKQTKKIPLKDYINNYLRH